QCRVNGRPDDCSESKLNPQPLRVPAHDERRDDRLVAPRRGPEEIDNWDLLLHSFAEPAVIRRVWVRAHECVFDNIIARVDLPMGLALVVIPDPTALPWKDGSDRQQPGHLAGFEDAPLRIDERDALALELKAARE